MADNITLNIAGMEFGGWQSVTVNRVLDTLAGNFSFNHSERWGGEAARREIREEDDCTIAIGGETVITGVVDEPAPSFDANTHAVSISGRDRTGDLIDCGILNTPMSWHDVKLERIVSEICKPFGIGVVTACDTGSVFGSFRRQPDETAFEAIERACRMRQVLAQTDAYGNLLLMRTDAPARISTVLREGKDGNILAASGAYSRKDRFSEYVFKGQQAGFDGAVAGETNGPEGRATDSGVRRYRPHVGVAEDQGTSAVMQARAVWQRNVNAARSRTADVTVQGFRDGTGDLWKINTLVPVDSPWLGIAGDMLISGVNNKQDSAGSITRLSLTLPGAFDVQAVPEEAGIVW